MGEEETDIECTIIKLALYFLVDEYDVHVKLRCSLSVQGEVVDGSCRTACKYRQLRLILFVHVLRS